MLSLPFWVTLYAPAVKPRNWFDASTLKTEHDLFLCPSVLKSEIKKTFWTVLNVPICWERSPRWTVPPNPTTVPVCPESVSTVPWSLWPWLYRGRRTCGSTESVSTVPKSKYEHETVPVYRTKVHKLWIMELIISTPWLYLSTALNLYKPYPSLNVTLRLYLSICRELRTGWKHLIRTQPARPRSQRYRAGRAEHLHNFLNERSLQLSWMVHFLPYQRHPLINLSFR